MSLPKTFTTQSPQNTQIVGKHLGRMIYTFLCQHPDPDEAAMTVALSGDLGAGKTTLTQGIAAGLGVAEQITSPTFTLVNEYTVQAESSGHGSPAPVNLGNQPITLVHMDSYRLANDQMDSDNASNAQMPTQVAQDAATFGIDEFFEIPRSLVIIEWAERLQSLLPPDHLAVRLSYGSDEETILPAGGPSTVRVIQVEAHGTHSQQILCALAEEVAPDA